MTIHPALQLTDEVATALREQRPVVSLESTIISHGMPYPRNVEMAIEVEQIIRHAVFLKPWGHGLPEHILPTLRGMSQLGG